MKIKNQKHNLSLEKLFLKVLLDNDIINIMGIGKILGVEPNSLSANTQKKEEIDKDFSEYNIKLTYSFYSRTKRTKKNIIRILQENTTNFCGENISTKNNSKSICGGDKNG